METRGKRIKSARTSRGIAAAELARRCGVTPVTLWKWETDAVKQVSGGSLVALAEALDVPAAWIENGGEAPKGITAIVAPAADPAEVQS